MARHRKTTEDRDVQTVIDGPALQQGAGSDAAAQTSDADRERETNLEVADQDAAQNAADAYDARTATLAEADAHFDATGEPEREAPKKETKAERFKRLAQKRVTKALVVLGHIHNLTNSNSYSYTHEQAERIVDALVLAVNKIADGFSGNKNGKVTFTL